MIQGVLGFFLFSCVHGLSTHGEYRSIRSWMFLDQCWTFFDVKVTNDDDDNEKDSPSGDGFSTLIFEEQQENNQ